MASTKTPKLITTIARYEHKNEDTGALTGIVSYLVRSSNGKDQYCTTLINGKSSACSCTGNATYHRTCQHMKQTQALENERKDARWTEYRRELACKLSQQFLTVEIVEQIVEQQQVETTAQPVERATRWDKDLCCKVYADNGEIVNPAEHAAKMKLQREAYEAEMAYREGKVWDSVISEWVTPASEEPVDHFASLKGTRVGRRKTQESDMAQKRNEIAAIKGNLNGAQQSAGLLMELPSRRAS